MDSSNACVAFLVSDFVAFWFLATRSLIEFVLADSEQACVAWILLAPVLLIHVERLCRFVTLSDAIAD